MFLISLQPDCRCRKLRSGYSILQCKITYNLTLNLAISRVLGHETFVYVPATVTSLPNNVSLTLGMLSYQSFTSQAPQIVHSGHLFRGKSHVPLFKITEASVTEDQRDGTRPQCLPPHPTLAAQKDTQPLSLSAA